MACRQSISTRATLLTKQFHPSFSHILHNKTKETNDAKSRNVSSYQHYADIKYLPKRSNHSRTGLGSLFQRHTSSSYVGLVRLGYSFNRYMSSTTRDVSNKMDDVGYVAEIITEKTDAIASQVPAVGEVAAAAADSAYPVAALQYLIDAVHSFTGLNWWASIALTTLIIRGATVPLLINQLKATAQLNAMRPHLEKLKGEIKDKATDPDALAEGQKQIKALFDEYGVSPLTPLKGLLIQGPIFISFFLAIRNMAEKVPSFQNGGALWFADLTTPDSFFVLPILTSLTFWITVESNMQEGLEGNPIAGTMKKFSRVLAVIAVPVMMTFPKALFCYWLTSNLFSLTYGLVIRKPEVKKFLNLPEIPVAPTAASQNESTMFSALKKYSEAKSVPSSPTDPSKGADRKISQSSIISQRIKSLEKQVKQRKKDRKR